MQGSIARAAALLVLVPVALIVGASPCLACSCLAASDEEHFAQAEVVFVGRAIERIDSDPGYSSSEIDWTFAVESVQKGETDDRQHVISNKSGATCGYGFTVDKRYQVFAYRDDKGRLATGLCTGNRELEANVAPYQPPTQPTPTQVTASPTFAPATPSPTPSPTATPTPERVTTPEPVEPSRSVVWPSVAAALALGALGLAAALTLRRRS